MMKKTKPKILVVEKSDIIQKGLAGILLDKSNDVIIVEQCNGDCDWQRALSKNKFHIFIANPFIFEENKKHFKMLKQKHNLQTVGLIYAYHHPDILKKFDALIYLNDTPEKIKSTINGLLNSSLSSNTASDETLSARETEVLKWLASGYPTKKIADTLYISTHTVNAHRKNIMRKLDIKTVSGLTIYAVLNNIINLEEA